MPAPALPDAPRTNRGAHRRQAIFNHLTDHHAASADDISRIRVQCHRLAIEAERGGDCGIHRGPCLATGHTCMHTTGA